MATALATAIATNQAPFSSLRSISVSEFATGLKKAEHAINFLLNLVSDRLGIDHDRVLAGRYAFAALARLVSESGGSIEDAVAQQRLLYWYVNTFLWGRYSGSTETVLQRDLEVLSGGGIDGLIDELNRWRGSLAVRPEDFDGWSVGARFYPLLYVLTRVSGARDLGHGMRLKAGMLGATSRLQLHHIFPKARLREAGYGHTLVNAIANFCFLTAGSNLQISASDPMKYLAEVDQQHPGVLESQWIPTDRTLWDVRRYEDFLAARRALLAAAANDLLSSLFEGAQPVDERVRVASSASPSSAAQTDYEIEAELRELIGLSDHIGIPEPEVHFEITDEESGEILAMADLAWPDGIQPGRTEPVAYLLEPDEDMESRLGELGYRFFLTRDHLIWYMEEVLDVDLDQDDVIGEAGDRLLDAADDAQEEAVVRDAPDEALDRSESRSWTHDQIRQYVRTDFLREVVDGFEDWLESLNCEVRHRVSSNHSVYLGGRRMLFYYFAQSWLFFKLPRATDEEIERLRNLPGPVRVSPSRGWVSGHVGSEEALELVKAVVAERAGLPSASPVGSAEPQQGDDEAGIERSFHRAMVEIYQRAQKEAGYTASYFMQMVAERGGLATARALIASPRVSEGFTSLWARGRLDLSVEAYVLRPEFKMLFSKDELATARSRLRAHGFEPPT